MDGNDTIKGGEGNDTLAGSSGIDTIHGNGGDDCISGDSEADTIYGDDGNDYMWGGDGNDNLYGGDGADHIAGEDGGDQLYGENGNDFLVDTSGQHDELRGGDGDDLLDCWDDLVNNPRNRTDYVDGQGGSGDTIWCDDSDTFDPLDRSENLTQPVFTNNSTENPSNWPGKPDGTIDVGLTESPSEWDET
jgi:Ca2+-binding RTX toxin-like protein